MMALAGRAPGHGREMKTCRAMPLAGKRSHDGRTKTNAVTILVSARILF